MNTIKAFLTSVVTKVKAFHAAHPQLLDLAVGLVVGLITGVVLANVL